MNDRARMEDRNSSLDYPGSARSPAEKANSSKARVLVAGIGNIFMGDDAFGVETVNRLIQRPLPNGVRVVDFGIRSFDLALAMGERYEAIILVDIASRGQPPGTLFLIEPDVDGHREIDPGSLDAHSLDPARMLQLAKTFGNPSGKLYLVGCEPAVLESDNGQICLSEIVQAAVPLAVDMIEHLVKDLLEKQPNRETKGEISA